MKVNIKVSPLVSVVVPVFNVAPYLPEALDSLINQTYRNLEILIIDDGSNDGSEIICDEYEARDSRIRVFHQDNKGLSAARNVGLDNMTGEITAFLDPDDVMYPQMIETALNVMVEKRTRVVAFGAVWYHNGKTVSAPEDGYYDNNDTLLNFYTRHGIAAAIWTKVFEASLFENIRFREGHNYADAEVFFRILDKCKTLYAIHVPLFRYRKRSFSITATHSLENRLDALKQCFWVAEYAKSMNVDGDIIIKFETQSIKSSLGGFNALYDNHSEQSELAKQFFKFEILKRAEKISYEHFLVKMATKAFLFSPSLFVFLYRVIHAAKII